MFVSILFPLSVELCGSLSPSLSNSGSLFPSLSNTMFLFLRLCRTLWFSFSLSLSNSVVLFLPLSVELCGSLSPPLCRTLWFPFSPSVELCVSLYACPSNSLCAFVSPIPSNSVFLFLLLPQYFISRSNLAVYKLSVNTNVFWINECCIVVTRDEKYKV